MRAASVCSATITVAVAEHTDAARVTAYTRWGTEGDTQDRTVDVAASADRQSAQWHLVAGDGPGSDPTALPLTGRGTLELGFRYVSATGVQTLTRAVTYVYRVHAGQLQIVQPAKIWRSTGEDDHQPDNGGPLTAQVT